MINNIIDIKTLLSAIDNADVVTFDVFDTLIARSSSLEPCDVFYYIAKKNNLSDLNAIRFKRARKQAESLCRHAALIKEGHSEVTLQQIYSTINMSDFEITDELSFERSDFYVRPVQKLLYDYAITQGKIVYAISDIYLKKEEIIDILLDFNFQFKDVYTSCDHNCGKYDGELYSKFIKQENLDDKKILHIGDNQHSDIKKSADFNIQSLHIAKASDVLFRDSSFNLQSIAILHGANEQFTNFLLAYLAKKIDLSENISAAKMFAIIYAAPLIFNFINFLKSKATKNKIEKFYLMARDGYLLKDAMDALGINLNYSILECSRRSTLLPSAKLDANIWRIFFQSAIETPLTEVIDGLHLENAEEIKKIMHETMPEKTFLKDCEDQQIDLFLKRSYAAAKKQIDNEFNFAKKYFTTIGLPGSKNAVVDVGWSLSSQKAIESILGEKISGYYIGTSENSYSHSEIKGFLFNKENNASWSYVFRNAVELLELCFIAKEKQTIKYNEQGPVFRENVANESMRVLFATEMRTELLNIFSEIKKLKIEISEKNSTPPNWLTELFLNLARNPTLNEKILLGSIPHDRNISSTPYSTIADFWHNQQNIPTGKIVHRVKRALRRDGIKITIKKSILYTKRKIRAHMKKN